MITNQFTSSVILLFYILFFLFTKKKKKKKGTPRDEISLSLHRFTHLSTLGDVGAHGGEGEEDSLDGHLFCCVWLSEYERGALRFYVCVGVSDDDYVFLSFAFLVFFFALFLFLESFFHHKKK